MEKGIALEFSEFLTKAFLHLPGNCLWWSTVPGFKQFS